MLSLTGGVKLCLSSSSHTYHHSHTHNVDIYHLSVTSDSLFSAYVTVSSSFFKRRHLKQLESGATSFSVDDFTFDHLCPGNVTLP